MYQPITDDSQIDAPAIAASPLRGLLIAVPVAIGLWLGVAELASLLV